MSLVSAIAERAFPDDDRMDELDGHMLSITGLWSLAHHEQGRAGGEAFSHASAAFRDGRRLDRKELHRRGNAPRKVFLHDRRSGTGHRGRDVGS